MKTKLALATLTALLLTSGLASAQRTCNANPGWWESPGLLPVFSGEKGTPVTVDCNFQVWSWTAFVNAMQTDTKTKQPRVLSFPTYDDLKSGNPARAAVGPRTLTLKPRNQKPKAMSSIEQAGSNGVLVDQNGRAVYYATHMNPLYFAFTQKYFGPLNYAKAAPTLTYPLGATVFKTSWRILRAGENPTDAYSTTATIDLLQSDGKGGLQPSGKTQDNVRVALVGVHVVGTIQGHPEFAWATFEQLNNSPDLPPNMSPGSSDPVNQRGFTFYKAGTPASQSNQQPSSMTIDPGTQVIAPITNVFRQFAYGGATPPYRVTNIQQSNTNFSEGIKEHASRIDPSFSGYKLIGTVWIQANTLKPGDGNMDQESIGSIDLANSTLETFVQAGGTSCFSCHNTSAGPGYPGKDINLSHIILSVLPNNVTKMRMQGQ